MTDRRAIRERRRMIRRQLMARDIRDRRVLAALHGVCREQFVPPSLRHLAYADQPLPIGLNQTISQPYIVALMTQEAAVHRRSLVLEVGTGSGYQAAVLAKLARYVWSIERVPTLADRARRRLASLNICNVSVIVGDGATGHPERSPYDAIIVTAAAPNVPHALREQLAIGGRLVIPVGSLGVQTLYTVQRTPDGYREHTAGACRFVPLVSPDAFTE